ncbi:MAG: RNA-binding transcriptional accessory protein, partial [Spirochaetaceae bacterium]
MSAPLSAAQVVASELSIAPARVAAVEALLGDGATIPFIARYRKEQTGEMDEVVLRAVHDALARFAALDARRTAVLKSLAERDLLTDDLRQQIATAPTLAELEDVYLPYRPKRVTRATKARERGLEPLAALLLRDPDARPAEVAAASVDPERGVNTVDDALAGARDIIAEVIAEDRQTRSELRDCFGRQSVIASARSRRQKDNPRADVYRDYFAWSEPASRVRSHRVLAMLRGEREGFLVVHVAPPADAALAIVRRRWVGGRAERGLQMELAAADSYERLLLPSLETERKNELAAAAADAAAGVFAANLRDLLLAPPLGAKRVLAVDPGFRTGCKVVCLDEHGGL